MRRIAILMLAALPVAAQVRDKSDFNRGYKQPSVSASAPVACPTQLASGWLLTLDRMQTEDSDSEGLPIADGPISMQVSADIRVLHPLLKNKFSIRAPGLTGDGYDAARDFLDDLSTHLGAADSRPDHPTEKLVRHLDRVSRRFAQKPIGTDPQMFVTDKEGAAILVYYMDGKRGSRHAVTITTVTTKRNINGNPDQEMAATVPKTGSISVPISSLTPASQAFVASMDKVAITNADEDCAAYLKGAE